MPKKTTTVKTNVHVRVPLAGGGVEVAPAGRVVGAHHTPLQTTQHGHHVVLHRPRHAERREELRPAFKTTHLTGGCG